jgi:phosphotransferase system enzyme I (PtsP)
MADTDDLPLDVRVHEHGDARIDAILRLIDEASRPRPLPEVLAALCAEVSTIAPAEIVSFYLREKSGEGATASEELRMVANVGFPAGAVSQVRLRVGEGVTGHVAATLRPATLRLASEDARYKHFPGLGEENFPIFLAIPMLVGRRAEGVLVLQRRDGAFDDTELALATALATSFAYALERARARRSETSPEEDESRIARLEGIALSPGAELGRVETLPTFEGLAALERAELGDDADATTKESGARRVARLDEAFASLARDLSRVRRRLTPEVSEAAQHYLSGIALLEEDSRLLSALQEEAARTNLPLAVRKVAREYAQARYRKGADPSVWLAERAEEVEDFLLLVAARAVGARVPSHNAVLLLPDRLSSVVVLACISHKTSAIAVGNVVEPSATSIALARAAQLPVLGDVGGLFAWARAGDIVLLDGDEGALRVNPSPTQIAKFRQRERSAR